ncbi:hypothetical protein [Pseudomonas sp. NLJ1]|uniref:hypothetical protein n=1 Tax=Pseudomonas sp. NLJ1 TaxID=3086079 RepID=UPI003C6C400E
MKLVVNDSRILDFPSRDAAELFLNEERSSWEWLTQLPDQLKKGAKELSALILELPIIEAMHIPLGEGDEDEARLGTSEKPFVTQDSEEGRFIIDVLKYYDYVVAYYCVLFLNDQFRYEAYNNSALSETLRMPKYEYEKNTAMTLCLSLGNYDNFLGVRRQSEFQNILDEQRSDQAQFKSQAELLVKNHKSSVTKHLQDLTKANDRAKFFLTRRLSAVDVLTRRGVRHAKAAVDESKALYESAVGDSKASYENAIASLKAAQAAYTEQLDLKYSVNYWKARKWSHIRAKYGWLTAVILGLGLMLGSVGMYFAVGGLTNISHYLNGIYHIGFESPQVSSGPQVLTSGVNAILASSEIASVATNLTGAVLLIALLSILIRIALRQFSTHAQYELDASERITFIKTYLALMQEKQIKADEDRKLILECIFKASSSSATPEIAFSLPFDAITKVLGDRKP